VLAAFDDEDSGVRLAAFAAAAARRLRGGVPRLALALDRTGDERLAAVRALAELGDVHAVPALIACFAGAAIHERLAILAALARLGGDESCAFLATGVRHPEREVRRSAARGLALLAAGAHDDGEALFLTLAADEDWHVRHAAAVGLGRRAGASPAVDAALLVLARDVDPAVAHAARLARTARAAGRRV
jgi:HEAT repeat protein